MGEAMLSKSLIQFSVDGQGYVPSLLFDLRPNYDGDNEEKEMQKSQMAVWGSLTNTCEKKRSESKGEKKRYKHLNAEFQRIAKRDKKAFLMINAKK